MRKLSSKRVAAIVVVLALLALAVVSLATSSPDLRKLAARTELVELSIDDANNYWPLEGFVRMVPPVRLPSASPTRDQIEIWIRIPDDGVIEIVDTPDGERLLFPPGTIADRVEFVGEGDKRFVGDVRGTRFGDNGHQRFRILRPRRPSPDASLWGFEWVRGDRGQKRDVDTRMIAFLGDTPPGKNMLPEAREKYFRWFRSISDCAGCHPAGKPTNASPRARGMPNRATDANGMYTPATIFSDEIALEAYRPHDRNRDDPLIEYRCPSGEPTVEPGAHVSCPNHGVPTAFYDLRAALDSEAEHAHAVCRARKYLYTHLSVQARERVSEAMRICERQPHM